MAVAVFVAVLWARRRESALARRWLPSGIAMGYLFFGAVDSAIDQLVTTSITSYILVSFLFALLVRSISIYATRTRTTTAGTFRATGVPRRFGSG